MHSPGWWLASSVLCTALCGGWRVLSYAQPWVVVGMFCPARLGLLSAGDEPPQDENFKFPSRHFGGLGYVLKFDLPDCCMLDVGGSARPPCRRQLCGKSGGHILVIWLSLSVRDRSTFCWAYHFSKLEPLLKKKNEYQIKHRTPGGASLCSPLPGVWGNPDGVPLIHTSVLCHASRSPHLSPQLVAILFN